MFPEGALPDRGAGKLPTLPRSFQLNISLLEIVFVLHPLLTDCRLIVGLQGLLIFHLFDQYGNQPNWLLYPGILRNWYQNQHKWPAFLSITEWIFLQAYLSWIQAYYHQLLNSCKHHVDKFALFWHVRAKLHQLLPGISWPQNVSNEYPCMQLQELKYYLHKNIRTLATVYHRDKELLLLKVLIPI